jgi:hypothetical protein
LPLPDVLWGGEDLAACPVCDRRVYVAVFPALHRVIAGGAPAELILEEGVSSCFYHPAKKAVVTCDGCGRFLCSLCDIPLSQRHVCPACLQSGQGKGGLGTLDTQRVLWDHTALSLCLFPLLVWPITLLTAPAAVGCALYSLRRPTSLVSKSRLRAYLALGLGLAEMAGWAAIFLQMSR